MSSEADTVTGAVESVVEGQPLEVGGLMLRLMLHNAEGRESVLQTMYEAEVADHARTKEELAAAQARLSRIGRRLDWLFGDEGGEFLHAS